MVDAVEDALVVPALDAGSPAHARLLGVDGAWAVVAIAEQTIEGAGEATFEAGAAAVVTAVELLLGFDVRRMLTVIGWPLNLRPGDSLHVKWPTRSDDLA